MRPHREKATDYEAFVAEHRGCGTVDARCDEAGVYDVWCSCGAKWRGRPIRRVGFNGELTYE